MEVSSLRGGKTSIKIFWATTLAASLAALVWSVPGLTSFGSSQILGLVLAILIGGVAGRHTVRIPGKPWKMMPLDAVILWSAIWLGVSGAVIVAMTSVLASLPDRRSLRVGWSFGLFSKAIAVFLTAKLAYFVLSLVTPESFTTSAANLGLVASAIVLFTMAVGYFVVTGTLKAISLYLADVDSGSEILKSAFARPAIGLAFTVPVAGLFHGLFLGFGINFGFVVLPLAVIAHFANRFHNKRLEQKTREISEASRVHLATVEALATAIDARDQVGVGHVRRTQIYAVGMGHILGLPQSEIDALNAGALLHDIGKLAVPDHILNKPGRLTPAEMEKAKIHAPVGAAILEKVQFGYPVVPTVKYHHECWDGSGYPEGLKGTEIPLTARILAVADSYDTLRGARPYRAAVSREDARKFLINGAGSQFDPRLVDIFLRNLKKFEIQVENERLSYHQDALATEQSLNGRTTRDSKSYVEQIKRANREVFTLYELARIFSSSLNLEETFSLFAQKIRGLVPFDTCVVYLLAESGETAKAVYTEGLNADALLHREVTSGQGATGYVLKKRQPVCNVNPALDLSFARVEMVQSYSAMAALPLIADDKLLGAVSIYSCELEHYEDEHLRLLETVRVSPQTQSQNRSITLKLKHVR